MPQVLATGTAPALEAECGACVSLCCVALAFDAGEDFARDKAAGQPCPNLTGHGCRIHATLTSEGYQGCVRYDCTGAGQRVSQELFPGQSWQDDPTLLAPMMEAFRGMRAIQDRVVQLSAALALPLDDTDRATAQGFLARLAIGEVDEAMARDFPGSPFEQEIDSYVRSLARYVTR